MEKKIDIIPFLAGIVEENTHSYQSDFAYDERRLQKAMLEPSQENRTFLWMSRPSGTYCFLEREVFIRETSAHIVWTHSDYVATADRIRAYRIVVAPGQEGNFTLGTVKPLNYGEQVQRVMRNAIHAQTVDVTFDDGTALTMSYDEYSAQFGRLIDAHGKVAQIYFRPQNEAELAVILQKERMIPAVRKKRPQKKKPAAR